MHSNERIIAQTKQWITDVVVGCNFCPFAAREVKKGSIHYEVLHSMQRKAVLEALSGLFTKMDTDTSVETAFLIMPQGYSAFDTYLQLYDLAEAFLHDEKYDGIYQLASFHPVYLFAGATNDDPANYTNRSPFPMLHLLREESVTKAVESHPDVEGIPQNNIDHAVKKGLAVMQALRTASMQVKE